SAGMAGIIALAGGGPFTANDQLDRELLAEAGADRVVVLPTADAFENPSEMVGTAEAWGERLGIDVEALMVLQRGEALETGPAAAVGAARAVYVVGDSPIHLRSVLNDTPLFDALGAVVSGGGLVVGVAASAAALCDPMTDPRGGAFTIGLGMVERLALATGCETWTEDHLHRTLTLADVTVAELPTGSALVRRGTDSQQASWQQVGDVVLHGDLPA
ncbi:MAG: Type 1 glutamine amidotransferase-like domain-containing protein, partial [Ilumatobacteraceae bacterium]